MSISAKHVIVYKEPGRFCGWPANNGVWSWSDEILVGFQLAYYRENFKGHSTDRDRPFKVYPFRSFSIYGLWLKPYLPIDEGHT